MLYRARKGQMSYGRPIGILMLEEHLPCPPGTPANATTFAHPVCYEIVKGVDISSLAALNQPDSLQAFLDAGRVLVDKGVAAITGNCGLMIVHQEAMANALPVPVLMSSLVQLPLIARMLGSERSVGIMASSRNNLKPEHIRIAAAGAEIRTIVASMDGQAHFRAIFGEGVLDFEKVEAEIVEVAKEMVAEHPEVGAILFECTDLPPYAHAVQEATGLPIFDITTLINFAISGIVRRPFAGIY